MASRNKHVDYDDDDLEDYSDDDYADGDYGQYDQYAQAPAEESKYARDADFVPMATEDDIVAALRSCNYDATQAAAKLLPPPVAVISPPTKGKGGKGKNKGKGKGGKGTPVDLMAALSAPATKQLETISRPDYVPPPTAPSQRQTSDGTSSTGSRSTATTAHAASSGGAAASASHKPSTLIATRHRVKTGVAFPDNSAALPAVPEAIVAAQASSKPVLNLVVVGHVDSGKSTTMGRFLVEVGQVQTRTVHKYQTEAAVLGKGSFAYAWVMDQGKEERERGVTVDVAIKHFSTPHKHFTVLDAPGHADFVPNMIQGASQADVAILVVSALDSEYNAGFSIGKGQTREHALLVRSFGISQLVVAVNKMDLVAWDKEQFYKINKAVGQFLRSVGFKASNVTFVPISGLNALNVVKHVSPAQSSSEAVSSPAGDAAAAVPSTAAAGAGEDTTPEGFVPEAAWYTGPTLMEALDSVSVPARQVEAPLRFCVWDAFRDSGFTVTGRVESGYIQAHMPVMVHPQGNKGSIKSIQVRGSPVSVAVAGDIVDVVLGGGLDETMVGPGKVLCTPANAIPVVKKFRAQLLTLPDMPMPLVRGQQFSMHTHGSEVPVTITKIMYVLDAEGAPCRIKPKVVSKNATVVVKMELDTPVPLETFESSPRLGRFTLRYSGRTAAAGMVTKITG